MQLTEEKQNVPPEVSIWSRSGPILLLGAFAVLLFKYAPFYWPLTLIALTGYAATKCWKKGGLVLSIAALITAAYMMVRSGEEILWMTLLPTSIALSWMLIFFNDKERAALALERQEKLLSSEKNGHALQEQLRAAKFALAEATQKNNAEIERLNALNAKTSAALNTARVSVDIAEQEKENIAQALNAKCESLAQEILAHSQKEIDLKQALDCVQSELFTVKNTLSALQAQKIEESAPLEDTDSEDKELKYKYATLREQFDEKSATLDDTRKELFKVENELLALQKAWTEKSFEPSDEENALIRELNTLDEERHSLEDTVAHLQEFITSLLIPKKRVSAKPRKAEALPDMIQGIIDETVSVEFP
jgi:chromosome segregation ATPase